MRAVLNFGRIFALLIMAGLAPHHALAQSWPMPASVSEAPAYCAPPAGCVEPGPTFPYSLPIKRFVGRMVDSTNTTAWGDSIGFATARAYHFDIQRSRGRVFAHIGNVMASYSLSGLFGAYGLGSPMAYVPGGRIGTREQWLTPESYTYPSNSWCHIVVDGIQSLGAFDFDDRGNSYLSGSRCGWGITSASGALYKRMLDQGGEVIAAKGRSKYYAFLGVGYSTFKIFDATDPANPVNLGQTSIRIYHYAKNLLQDRVALSDGVNFYVYDPDSLASGKPPVFTQLGDSTLVNAQYGLITTDGNSFFVIRGEDIVVFSPSGDTYVKKEFPSVLPKLNNGFSPLSFQYGDGYLSMATMHDEGFSWGARVYRLDGDLAPHEVNLSRFIRGYYSSGEPGYISPGYINAADAVTYRHSDGKLYLFLAMMGLADVYEIDETGAPQPPKANADLAVSQSLSSSSAITNGTFQVTLRASNQGPGMAAPVVITHTLPSGSSYVESSSGSWNCSPAGDAKVVCGLAGLAAGSMSEVTVTYRAPAIASGMGASLAVISSNGVNDPVASNNQNSLPFSIVDASVPPPAVAAISPRVGLKTGGTAIVITGSGFQSGARVTLGGVPITVSGVTSTQINGTTPAHAIGPVDLVVTNPDTQISVVTGGFSYVDPSNNPSPTITSITPNSAPAEGGTMVEILGTNFQGGAQVLFNGTSLVDFNFWSSKLLSAVLPAYAEGIYDIKIVNPDGTSVTKPKAFIIGTPLSITSITPSSGPMAGGNRVTVKGKKFSPGLNLFFGYNGASVTFVDSETATAIVPSNTLAGKVIVTVRLADGSSFSLPDAYTFTTATPTPTPQPKTRAVRRRPVGGTGITVPKSTSGASPALEESQNAESGGGCVPRRVTAGAKKVAWQDSATDFALPLLAGALARGRRRKRRF